MQLVGRHPCQCRGLVDVLAHLLVLEAVQEEDEESLMEAVEDRKDVKT
jgi:hypothetical protein